MSRVFTITMADVGRCPHGALLPAHYRDNGTCCCRCVRCGTVYARRPQRMESERFWRPCEPCRNEEAALVSEDVFGWGGRR